LLDGCARSIDDYKMFDQGTISELYQVHRMKDLQGNEPGMGAALIYLVGTENAEGILTPSSEPVGLQ